MQANAIKYTPGGGSATISCKFIKCFKDLSFPEMKKFLDSSKGFGMLEIKVEDTGIGISPEDQRKLFKLFGFADKAVEVSAKGIGLGLHISQGITR